MQIKVTRQVGNELRVAGNAAPGATELRVTNQSVPGTPVETFPLAGDEFAITPTALPGDILRFEAVGPGGAIGQAQTLAVSAHHDRTPPFFNPDRVHFDRADGALSVMGRPGTSEPSIPDRPTFIEITVHYHAERAQVPALKGAFKPADEAELESLVDKYPAADNTQKWLAQLEPQDLERYCLLTEKAMRAGELQGPFKMSQAVAMNEASARTIGRAIHTDLQREEKPAVHRIGTNSVGGFRLDLNVPPSEAVDLHFATVSPVHHPGAAPTELKSGEVALFTVEP
jgi:hypothetical protein